MSKYEDYERENYAARYDESRFADGVESMVMMLSAFLKKPPSEVSFFHNYLPYIYLIHLIIRSQILLENELGPKYLFFIRNTSNTLQSPLRGIQITLLRFCNKATMC